MAAKRIFKKNCSERMEKSANNEIEMPSTSFSDGVTKMAPFRTFGTDSPPPQEPFTNDRRLPIDFQLLEMLKKNYDLISLITDIERERNKTPGLNIEAAKNLGCQLHLSPLPYLRHRAQSIAVPAIAVKESNLSPSSSLSSMNEDSIVTERSFCENLRGQWSDFYGQVSDAISETNDDIKARKSPEPQKLSPNVLKRDIRRCLSELQPYIETANGLRDLFIWRNPISSLCTFLVYIYCVFRGWTASLFFFIILFQLILNYFSEHKGINIGLNFLPRKEVTYKRVDSSGAQLVFDVARRTQIVLTVIADIFEKAKNLFTWKKPEITFKFFIIMLLFFVVSISCSNSTCLSIVGFALGGKAFITTYLFHRFPRLRNLFDIIFYFYDRLPTSRSGYASPTLPKTSACSLNLTKTNWKCSNETLSKSQSTNNILYPETDLRRKSIGVIPYHTSASCALVTPPTPTVMHTSETQGSIDDMMSTSDDSISLDIFMITRSCVLIDKDRPFPRGMSSGILMLNDKMLRFRFEKLKKCIRETIQIPFSDIVSVKKIRTMKTFSLMPGSSKALEIKLSTKRKAIQFVGIPKRDEFYESLIETARIAGVELILNDADNC